MTYEYYDFPRGTSGIYLLTNKVNGKQYVGQSWDVTYRWSSHKSEKRYMKFPLYNAIRKYGWHNFDKTILVRVANQEDLDMYESKLIESFNTMTPNGYNCKDGGEGRRVSEETKAKLSAATKGKPKSPETREKIAAANREKAKDPKFLARVREGRKGWKGHTEESKAKIRAARAKQVITQESRDKAAETRRGKKATPEHALNISLSHAKRNYAKTGRIDFEVSL